MNSKRRHVELKFNYHKLNEDLHQLLNEYLDEKSKHNLWVTNKKRISKLPKAAFSFFTNEAKNLKKKILENSAINFENTLENFLIFFKLVKSFDAYLVKIENIYEIYNFKYKLQAIQSMREIIGAVRPLVEHTREHNWAEEESTILFAQVNPHTIVLEDTFIRWGEILRPFR